jgi:hypothetical protein
MCYPDLRTTQAIIEMHLAEAQTIAASKHLRRRAQPTSTRRLWLLSHMGHALAGLGQRITEVGLALQRPDLPQPSLQAAGRREN